MASKAKKRRSSGGKPKKKMLVPFVGVVSSIPLSSAMKSAFETGLGSTNVQYTADVKYKKRPLRKAIKDFNGKTDCVLIVTVGGLIVWEAANSVLDKSTDKKFVSAVGAEPDDPSDRFFGGVSVQKPGSNEERISALITDKKFKRSEICLLYNPNSEQRNKELGEWTGANPVPGGINAKGENVATKYATAFGRIPDTIQAVVVSADPHFFHTRDDLIEAANDSTKFICYPLQDYKNTSGTRPNSGSSRFHGPALTAGYVASGMTAAYHFLGQRAAAAILASTPLAPLIMPADSGLPVDI